MFIHTGGIEMERTGKNRLPRAPGRSCYVRVILLETTSNQDTYAGWRVIPYRMPRISISPNPEPRS